MIWWDIAAWAMSFFVGGFIALGVLWHYERGHPDWDTEPHWLLQVALRCLPFDVLWTVLVWWVLGLIERGQP
jgi:hypothetical protein